jgi:hypothetical protein
LLQGFFHIIWVPSNMYVSLCKNTCSGSDFANVTT